MDTNPGTKWSRNLSDDSQTESNRLRLIERQRQLLESKLQRQHQVVATTTRPSTARSIKSAKGRSSEKLIDLDEGNVGGLVNTGLSSTELSLSSSASENFKDSIEALENIQSLSQTHIQSSESVSPFSSPKNASVINKTQIESKAEIHLNKSDNSIQSLKINSDKNVFNQQIVELNPLSSILSNEELLLFATQPISPQTTLQCTIIRDKKGLDRSLYPTYYMHLQAIVSNSEQPDKNEKSSEPPSPKSRKNSVELINFTNESPINSNSETSQTNGGTSRGSQNSSNYRQETNVLGFKGPRKMTALIPRYEQINTLTNSSIFDEWKRNNKAILQLKNKTPVWNDETQSYVLNFKGRVTQASVKNFQLVTCSEREDIQLSSPTNQSNISNQSNASFAPTIPVSQPLGETVTTELVSMQFGRVSTSQFSCDVSWPLSLLQAFAVALSSFDSKLACE